MCIDNAGNFFRKTVLAGGAVLVAGSFATAADTTKPNVVLILVDDLGWTDLGCFGSRYYETPNIDKLRQAGMKFTQGYAACAVCSPSRASIQTGRTPPRVGITDWIHQGRNEKQQEQTGKFMAGYEHRPEHKLDTPINGAFLPHSEVTAAELLKKQGYATCYIGKWHLGGGEWLPNHQGFDESIGATRFGNPGSYYDPYPKGKVYPRTSFKARKHGEYLTDREAEEAVKFIRQHKDSPFFLQLSHYAVHAPIMPKKSLLDKYKHKKPTGKQRCPEYATMVESVDQSTGRIMRTLKELGLTENTLIIFTGDNGGASHVRCHGVPATDNSPLRKGKGYAYEGGLRVPYIFTWPERIKPDTTCEIPINGIDIMPTICAAAGARLPTDRKIDGVNLLPLLEGKGKIPPRVFTWHFPHYWYGTHVRPYSVIRDGNWKLIRRYETGKQELYNLKDDLSETTDLANSHPEIVERLGRELDRELKNQHARFPRPAKAPR